MSSSILAMRSLLLSQLYLGRVAKRHAECIRNETNMNSHENNIIYAYQNTCFSDPESRSRIFVLYTDSELEFLKSLWGLGTEEE
jgi:hypothetical protein